MPRTLACLVISDLHTTVGGRHEDDSYLSYHDGKCDFASELVGYLKELGKSSDVLICPGDIANRAEKESFESGWILVNQIRKELSIPTLLSVPGNHDHDSRPGNSIDPKTYMQFMTPGFPTSGFDSNTHFWAWNWFPMVSSDFNAILLNTSAYHGLKDEHLHHGRILPEIRNQILSRVQEESFPKRDLNILVCHHHPVKLPAVAGVPDAEMIHGGDDFINELIQANKGPWLVVHGHRHLPMVWYAGAESVEFPVVFSAGTLSAKLSGPIADQTSNQLYFVEVDLDESRRLGRPVGTFETHEYTFGRGWSLSKSENLPPFGGFGGEMTPSAAVSFVENILGSDPIVDEVGRQKIELAIKNLSPKDLVRLEVMLKEKRIHVNRSGNRVIQVGRRR